MRQEKRCQRGLGYPGPHYMGGLSERIILIHSCFKSFFYCFFLLLLLMVIVMGGLGFGFCFVCFGF